MSTRPHPFASVRLIRPVEEFPVDTRAIVIEEYPARDAYLIEILDEHGDGIDILSAVAADLELLASGAQGAQGRTKQPAA